MNLYLTSPGRLSRKDNTLQFNKFEIPDERRHSDEPAPLAEDDAVVSKHVLPVETIDAVYLFDETRLNTKLLNFLAQRRVPLHVFNYWGHHTGTFMPHAEQHSGDLVVEQGQAFRDRQRRMTICRAIAEAKLHNMLSVIAYYRRRHRTLDETEKKLRELKAGIDSVSSPEKLMGIEGLSSRLYYQSWHHWLKEAPAKFTRIYHPPDNPLNAMISFLNAMLYTACVSELYRTALYPGISYIHAPQSRRYSLALDLVEPFKPLMVDRLIFRLFGHGDIAESDFEPHSNGVLLTDSARKNVLSAWDEQLRTTVEYEPLNRSVSYRQLLRLDCYKLIKHLLEEKQFTPYRIAY